MHLSSAAEELGVQRTDLALMKKQRVRDTLVRLFRAAWTPVVISLCGFSAGTISMIIYNRANSYPFAVIGLAAIAPASTGQRSISRVLLVYVPLAVFSFVVGLKTGDIISPQKHLAAGALYGVVHQDVIEG